MVSYKLARYRVGELMKMKLLMAFCMVCWVDSYCFCRIIVYFMFMIFFCFVYRFWGFSEKKSDVFTKIDQSHPTMCFIKTLKQFDIADAPAAFISFHIK